MNIIRIRRTAAKVVTLPNGTRVLISYSTPVAAFVDGNYYRTDRYYSVTTSKHINEWTNDGRCSTVPIKPQEYFDGLLKNKEEFDKLQGADHDNEGRRLG